MREGRVTAIAFDLYGTLVNVGTVAEACSHVTSNPGAFVAQWRAKQLEYTFLRSLMGTYRDFWRITEESLNFTEGRFALALTPDQRHKLMQAWLHPAPYPDSAASIKRLKEHFPLALLSNGTPQMLRAGLVHAGLNTCFRHILSAHSVKVFKPSPKVYRLALKRLRLTERELLFVSSNAFDVMGAKQFGLRVCWVNRSGALLDPLGPVPDLVVDNLDGLADQMLQEAPSVF